jgi:anti-anti-sigma factor
MEDRGESRLRLCGALDAATVANVTRAFDAAVAEGNARITIVLEQVTLMDSVGARALRDLATRMKAEGRKVTVVGATDQPLLVLKLLRLDALLREEPGPERPNARAVGRARLSPRGASSSPPSTRSAPCRGAPSP